MTMIQQDNESAKNCKKRVVTCYITEFQLWQLKKLEITSFSHRTTITLLKAYNQRKPSDMRTDLWLASSLASFQQFDFQLPGPKLRTPLVMHDMQF